MFTVKIYYASLQTAIYSCDQVNIGSWAKGGTNEPTTCGKSLSLFGPGERGEQFELDGTETVYIENAAGKTVEVIRPNRQGHPNVAIAA